MVLATNSRSLFGEDLEMGEEEFNVYVVQSDFI